MLIHWIRQYFIQDSSLLLTFTSSCHRQYLHSNHLVTHRHGSMKKLRTKTSLSFHFYPSYEPKETELKHQNNLRILVNLYLTVKLRRLAEVITSVT